MNIGKIRTLIENKSDKDLVFFAMYDKDEVDEFIENNFDENTAKVTEEEWLQIYTSMIEDDGIWQEINESFRYYIEKIMEQREKGK